MPKNLIEDGLFKNAGANFHGDFKFQKSRDFGY